MTYEDHKDHILDILSSRLVAKYDQGAKEHGGYLWEMPVEKLLDNALDEAIDQCVYLITLKMELEKNRG